MCRIAEQPRHHVSDLQADTVPARPGIYGFFVRSGQALAGTLLQGLPDGACVYVGKTERGLRVRIWGEHLRTGKSGKSAFRRTLGAVLKDQLRLRCVPRSDGRPSFYQFHPQGEEALTAWMRAHLDVAWCETPGDGARGAEAAAIAAVRPALNDEAGHPWTAALSDLRDRCLREAGVR